MSVLLLEQLSMSHEGEKLFEEVVGTYGVFNDGRVEFVWNGFVQK